MFEKRVTVASYKLPIFGTSFKSYWMNPYLVLNVPLHATNEEIKSSYRRLVKQYHPDKNNTEAAKVIIIRVNEAYEILSDPSRKDRFDRGIIIEYEQTHQADPVEEYKREFKFRKQQEAKKKVEDAKENERFKFSMARLAAIPISIFAFFLVVDELLPEVHVEEIATNHYQLRKGGGRRSQGVIINYISTTNFTLAVPYEVYADYDYSKNSGIEIGITPMLHTPVSIIAHGIKNVYHFRASDTIYSGFLHLHYLLLVSSLFTIIRREYNMVNYGLCYLPMLILGFIIYGMIP